MFGQEDGELERGMQGGTGEEEGKCQGNFKATKRDNIVEFQAEVIRV